MTRVNRNSSVWSRRMASRKATKLSFEALLEKDMLNKSLYVLSLPFRNTHSVMKSSSQFAEVDDRRATEPQRKEIYIIMGSAAVAFAV